VKENNPVASELDQQQGENVENVKEKLIDKVKLASLEAELKRTGVKTAQIIKQYMVFALKELNLEQWKEVMARLEKVETKQKKDLGL